MNAATLAVLVGETSSSIPPEAVLALGPLAGVGLYMGLWRKYRNAHRSHDFERDSLVKAQPVTGSDTQVDTVEGTTRKQIHGCNTSDHRRRLGR